jgi:hypothetical protein
VTGYLVGEAAKGPAGQTAAPMHGHDDKVNALDCSHVNDFLSCQSAMEQDSRFKPLPAQFLLLGFR